MYLVTVEEMRSIEKSACEKGMPYETMMANAGKKLAQVIEARYTKKRLMLVTGLVGSGNNGGDTLIALISLQKSGWNTAALLLKERPNDSLVKNYLDSGGRMLTSTDHGFAGSTKTVLQATGVLLDGVLGTGVKLPLKEDARKFLSLINKELAGQTVVAVDCPSGVDCDSGDTAPETIHAELTVCMEAIKTGLLKFPAFEFCGEVMAVSIGLEDAIREQNIKRNMLDRDWVKGHLPKRPMTAHKGTFGTVMVVGGCANYVGAPLLSGKAAYRSGSGLVTLAVPQSIHPILAGYFPEAVWLILSDEGGVISELAADTVTNHLSKIDVMVVGPGIGREATTQRFLDELFFPRNGNGKIRRVGFLVEPENEKIQKKGLPKLLIDADGLRWLATHDDWHEKINANIILTPHPGEMASLTGLSIDEIQQNRIEVAEVFAKKWKQVLVLKGALTVIAAPDGRTAIVPVASSSLAKAGSGDVLSGMIASFVGQGLELFDAACVGAWIHANAGLSASGKLGGDVSIIATDIIDAIPHVFSGLR